MNSDQLNQNRNGGNTQTEIAVHNAQPLPINTNITMDYDEFLRKFQHMPSDNDDYLCNCQTKVQSIENLADNIGWALLKCKEGSTSPEEFRNVFVHLSQWWNGCPNHSWKTLLEYLGQNNRLTMPDGDILINCPTCQDIPAIPAVAEPVNVDPDYNPTILNAATMDIDMPTATGNTASMPATDIKSKKNPSTPNLKPAPTPHKIKTPRILVESDTNASAKSLFSDASDYDLKISADETKRVTEQELTKREEQVTKQAQEKTKQLELQLELAKLQQSNAEASSSKSLEVARTESSTAPKQANPVGLNPLKRFSKGSDTEESNSRTSKRTRVIRATDFEDIMELTGKRFPTALSLQKLFKPSCEYQFKLIGQMKDLKDENGMTKKYKMYSCKCDGDIRIRIVKDDDDVYTVQKSNWFCKHANGSKVVPFSSNEEP